MTKKSEGELSEDELHDHEGSIDDDDEEVELTKEESKLIHRMLKGEDPYAPYVDLFKWDDAIHPLSSAPEPKRRFTPSPWEAKNVVKYVRAVYKGLIKLDKPEEEPNVYLLWGDDSPELNSPGDKESYSPPLEYIPTEEEKASYGLVYEEERPKFRWFHAFCCGLFG